MTVGNGGGAGSNGGAVADDMIDLLARVRSGSAVEQLRAARPALTRFSQESYAALLEPADGESLSQRERELVALRVAILTPDYRLARYHQERAVAAGATSETTGAVLNFPAASPELTAREVAALRHTDLLVNDPAAAGPDDLARLREVGFATRDIITLDQLIAFLTYQVRVLAVVHAFGEDR